MPVMLVFGYANYAGLSVINQSINLITGNFLYMVDKIVTFVSDIEFVANIDENKDCLMNQSTHSDNVAVTGGNPLGLWYNIDVPKGHGLKAGDKIRIIIEKV
jgi:galactokinase/mevalonate kinase-like predicted kinase